MTYTAKPNGREGRATQRELAAQRVAQRELATRGPLSESQINVNNEDTIDTLKEEIKGLKEKASAFDSLQDKMIEMQKENRHVRRMARKGNMTMFTDNDVAVVATLTKTIVYPKCQYINSDEQLNKVTKMLARKQTMTDSFEDFNIYFRDIILKTINQMRNASVQSMRKIYESKCNCLTRYNFYFI